MTDFANTLGIVTSGLRAQSTRLKHVSENIANADTPGFRRKTISFSETAAGQVETGPVQLDQTALARIYDPSHPLADGTGHFDGSNVNLIFEMADAREAQRSYEANLKLFEQTRKMSANLLDLLRK